MKNTKSINVSTGPWAALAALALAVLKLEGIIHISWALVTLPLWLPFAIMVAILVGPFLLVGAAVAIGYVINVVERGFEKAGRMFTLLAILTLGGPASAQTIAAWRFDNATQQISVAASSNDPKLASAPVLSRVGVNTGAGANMFNSNGWITSFAPGKYLLINVVPQSPNRMALSNMAVEFRQSSTGPTIVKVGLVANGVETIVGPYTMPAADASATYNVSFSGVSPTGSRPVEIHIYGYGNPASTTAGTLRITALSLAVAQPLPVTLTKLIATSAGNAALIAWSTASEKDNVGFVLERSSNAVSFDSIGFVPSAGGNTPATYAYTDACPAQGLNYYRLVQLNWSGAKSYSPVVSASFEKFRSSFYPAPASSGTYSLYVSRDATVALITLGGSTVYRRKAKAGVTSYCDDLAPGVYYLLLVSGGERSTHTIFIQ